MLISDCWRNQTQYPDASPCTSSYSFMLCLFCFSCFGSKFYTFWTFKQQRHVLDMNDWMIFFSENASFFHEASSHYQWMCHILRFITLNRLLYIICYYYSWSRLDCQIKNKYRSHYLCFPDSCCCSVYSISIEHRAAPSVAHGGKWNLGSH